MYDPSLKRLVPATGDLAESLRQLAAEQSFQSELKHFAPSTPSDIGTRKHASEISADSDDCESLHLDNSDYYSDTGGDSHVPQTPPVQSSPQRSTTASSNGVHVDKTSNFCVLSLPRKYSHQSEYKADLGVPCYAKLGAAADSSYFASNQHLLHYDTSFIVVTHSVLIDDSNQSLEEWFSCSVCGDCSSRIENASDSAPLHLGRFFRADQVFRHEGYNIQYSLSNTLPGNTVKDAFYRAACSHARDLVYHLSLNDDAPVVDNYHPTGSSLQTHSALRLALREKVSIKVGDGEFFWMPDQIPRYIGKKSDKVFLYAFPNCAAWTSGAQWGVMNARPHEGYDISQLDKLLDVDYNKMSWKCTHCLLLMTCKHAAFTKTVWLGKDENAKLAASSLQHPPLTRFSKVLSFAFFALSSHHNIWVEDCARSNRSLSTCSW
jgi:hypothetical protein